MEVPRKVRSKKISTEKVSKENDKYKVILKLINKILVNLEKPEIDDITQFVNIDREDVIKEKNCQVMTEMEPELFPLFNKDKCGYYRHTQYRILSILRCCLKDMGYELLFKKKELYFSIDGKNYRKSHVFYYIK